MTRRRKRTPTDPVVLVRIDGGPLEHGVLGVIRSLGRLGAPVHLAGGGHTTLLERSRYLTSCTPLPPDDPAGIVDALVALASRVGDRPVLLAIGDPAALLVDEAADALAAAGYRFPRPPAGLPRRFADKGELTALAEGAGVDVPRTIAPTTLAGAEAFAAAVGYPLMVKAADPRRIDWAGGQVSVRRVADPTVLRDVLLDDAGGLRPNLLLQEFIAGGTDGVWFFHGYFDASSTCLAGFVGRKLREHPPGAGPTTLGVVAANDAVRDAAVGLLAGCGYRGLVDAEFRHDPATGRHLLLDLNPRIGANFRLFVDAAGHDVARVAYLDLVGRPVTAGPARPGRRWWVESLDPATWRAYFGRGRRPWREVPRSLAGVRELAWWAADDPRPFVGMVRERAGGLARRTR